MTKDEIIQQILPAVVEAPSAHNTQPWSFVVQDNTLDIYADWSRHLEVSDPTERELHVSLGCASANAQVAFAQAGKGVTVTHYPEGEGRDKPAVRLTVTDAPADEEVAALFPAITARRTDRSFFDKQPLTEAERTQLRTRQHPDVSFIETPKQLTAIGTYTEQASLKTLARADFKAELANWVRNSWTKQPDGMPGYAMGIPAVASLLAPVMVKVAPIHKQEGPKTRRQAETASAIAVVATETDAKSDWLRAGELFEQLWLEATKAGLGASPLTAAIEAGDETRNGIKDTIKTDKYPQCIIRFGHSEQKGLRASPRRSVEDCLRK